MTSEGLGEMFEGDSADKCAGKFPLLSMVGQVEGLTCADPGARTPIRASGNYDTFSVSFFKLSILINFSCKTMIFITLILGSCSPKIQQN